MTPSCRCRSAPWKPWPNSVAPDSLHASPTLYSAFAVNHTVEGKREAIYDEPTEVAAAEGVTPTELVGAMPAGDTDAGRVMRARLRHLLGVS